MRATDNEKRGKPHGGADPALTDRNILVSELERLRLRVQQLEAQIANQAREPVSSEYLASGLNAAGRSICMTDAEGIIRFVNPAFTRLTGYTADEIVGQKPKVLRSGIHPPEFYAHLWDTILAGDVWSNEVMNRRKDGTAYVVQLTIAPVHNDEGELIGFVSVHNDITQWKQTASDREKEIEDLKGVLAAVIPLGSFLTICASCKKLEDEKGKWARFEEFIADHTDIQISHGLCPDCARTLYPECFKNGDPLA